MITIDYLRRLGGTIRPEGIGVLKYRVGNEAYHFYDGTIHEVRNTGIHQHYWNFSSEVIKGELRNRMYVVNGTDSNSTLQVVRKKDANTKKFSVEQDNITLTEAYSFSTVAKQSYYLYYTVFHKIEMMSPKVVTHLRCSLRVQETIGYIKDTTIQTHEPNPSMTEDECWEIAEDILNG
jgi:hypothetical protein